MRPSKFVTTSAKLPLADAKVIAETLVAQLPGLVVEVTEYHEESDTGVFEAQRRTRIEIFGLDREQNPIVYWLSNLQREYPDATWQWSQMIPEEERIITSHRIARRMA